MKEISFYRNFYLQVVFLMKKYQKNSTIEKKINIKRLYIKDNKQRKYTHAKNLVKRCANKDQCYERKINGHLRENELDYDIQVEKRLP